MQHIKLHEATKQFKISNKLAMFFLEKKNIPVKSHSSAISMEQLELLREFSSNKDNFSDILDEFNKAEKKDKKPKVVSKKSEPKKVSKKEVVKDVEEKPEAKVVVKKVEEEKVVEPRKEEPVKEEVKKTQVKEEEEIEQKEEKAEVEVLLKDEKKVVEKAEPKKVKKPKKVKEKKPEVKETKKEEEAEPEKIEKKVIAEKKEKRFDLPELIQISNYITVKELAEKLGIKLKYIEEKMKILKKEYLPNQIISTEDVNDICNEFGVEVDVVTFEDYVYYNHIEKFNAKLSPRPPVVTIMGHVDHGKTTLLDTLRNTRVVEKEAGGITQKIGAYRFRKDENDIIFIDTPGHEAFTNLRARGAKVTDIVILIVAANEGVKPQTVEAINHALSANVPIIVAINKIDMDSSDPDKIKQQLADHKILVEDWGGDVVSVEISAKLNKNLDSLLEMLSLLAEMQELKSYKDIPGRGTIIESRMDLQLGPIGTVLIQHGKVTRGNFFICGNSVGKIKSIFDDSGKTLTEAEVPLPVEIMGFENIPESGQIFQVVDDIEKARKIIDMRKLKEKEVKREEIIAEKKQNLQNLFEKFEEFKTKVFPIIIKTDNFGSSEVLEKIILNQSFEKLKVNIVHKGIGNVSESDILLASTSGSTIIGFNIKASQKVLDLAKKERIKIKLYNVIYHLIEDIEKTIQGEIEPEYIETLIGKIEVLQKFKISKIGNIAGCLVKEGKVTNKSKVRVLRDDNLVFEGEIETLKRIKDEVTQVKAGTECGIKIKNFNAIEIGDILEAYELSVK